MKTFKIFETFAGIGSQYQALKNIKESKDWEIVNGGFVEWYIPAIIGYMQLHYPNLEMPKDFTGSIADLPLSINSKTLASPKTLKRYDNTITAFLVLESKKLGNQFNIMEVERIPNDLDLLTYSFPCQDLSVQGKRAGMVEKETRSGLVWEISRILKNLGRTCGDEALPKYLLMENVPAILHKQHKPALDNFLFDLQTLGYFNAIYTLNSSDFGSPQNRKRVFILSVKSNEDFTIPNFKTVPNELKTPMDVFPELAEAQLLPKLADYELTPFALTSGYMCRSELPKEYVNWDASRRVYDVNFTGPTILTDGNIKIVKHSPFKLSPNNIRKADLQDYSSFQSERLIYDPARLGPTVTASGANSNIKVVVENKIYLLPASYLYRYQGFSAENFKAITKNNLISDNKLKFLIGNSIHVQVLEAIFKRLN